MSSINVAPNSALQAGLKGYQAGSETLSRSATILADTATQRNGTGQSAGLHSTAVELRSGLIQAKASAEVIEKVAGQNGILGSIIDTYA